MQLFNMGLAAGLSLQAGFATLLVGPAGVGKPKSQKECVVHSATISVGQSSAHSVTLAQTLECLCLSLTRTRASKL